MPYEKPKSQFWWISYTDASGHRIRCSSGTADFKEAKSVEQRLRAEGFENRGKASTQTGFAAIMLEYLKSRQQERELYVTAQLREHFGALDMTQLKPSDVREYITKRKEAGKADSTIARELAVLSAAINHYCTEHGVALPNPVKGRKPKQQEGRVRWISTDEARALILAAEKGPGYLAGFIQLGLNTGMRKQEMLGLEWDRVNFGQRLIFLESIHTKGKRRRSVPINEAARLALLSRWNWAQKHCKDTRWVFCGDNGERIRNVRKSFLTACERAGIRDFHIHDLRHTCAAWLVSSGAPLAAVRDLLGHRSITTTEIYAHLAPAAVRDAVERLPGCHTFGHTKAGSGSNGWARTTDTSIMNAVL